MNQILQWLLFLMPLASLLLIKEKVFKRFLPVALFVTIINTLFYQAAYHYNWWRELGLFDWDKIANIPWVYSAYLIATIWIFKFTYGRFKIYLLTNLILDGVYIYIWYPILQKLGLAISELSPHISYLLMVGVAILIYLFQMWFEKGERSTKN
ncbi:hypothetical protein [Rossellomorea marisflavi]|uniref:hypothetical protein n=1 Tax=Rossellomorea marisflavi TaxID=189381 RepID=UPI00203F3D0D|nr:hypothetical protein [Rossellomorea marisflavi]MCM2603344.1 hypothetical protein [Rossellomorea marisflavi]USK93003.1 hypothetical protein LIT29_04425 [Rossellomorea marisflavi]